MAYDRGVAEIPQGSVGEDSETPSPWARQCVEVSPPKKGKRSSALSGILGWLKSLPNPRISWRDKFVPAGWWTGPHPWIVRLRKAPPRNRWLFIGWTALSLAVASTCATILYSLHTKYDPARSFDKDNKVVFVTFVAILGLFFRRGARMIVALAPQARRDDSRPPILLLRSFTDESLAANARQGTVRGTFLSYVVGNRLEELIAGVLNGHGPVVAIGDPKERLPLLGAAREYATGADWRELFTARLDECNLVVAVLGDTSGLLWELETVFSQDTRARHIIFVVPPKSRGTLDAAWGRVHSVVERYAGRACKIDALLPPRTLLVSFKDRTITFVTASAARKLRWSYKEAFRVILPERAPLAPLRR